MARAGIITPTPLATPEEVATLPADDSGGVGHASVTRARARSTRSSNGRVFYDWADVLAVGRSKHHEAHRRSTAGRPDSHDEDEIAPLRT